MPFSELWSRGYINERGRAAGTAADFSRQIREGLSSLNTAARSVIEELRTRDGGQGPVFTYRGRRVGRMHNSAWKRAWRLAGLPIDPEWLRGVHCLKHTLGRRLRAAGVPLETRRVLLGHKNGDITSHYSVPEIRELIDAAERVCVENVHEVPTLALLKTRAASESVH